MYAYKNFHINLNSARKKFHLTQSEVARELNISRQAYNQYEKGNRFPSIATLTNISNFFQISIDDLLGNSNTNNIDNLNNPTFGIRLKELRKTRDFESQYVAKSLDVAKSTYSEYENDKVRPSFETLNAIADFFDVSIDYLLCRTDQPNSALHINTLTKKEGSVSLDRQLSILRKEKKLTQEDIAELLKITTSAYGFYEQGKTIPNAITISTLADFYDVSLDFLIGKVPFRTEIEAQHSIAVAAMKFIRAESIDINVSSGLDALIDAEASAALKSYSENLTDLFDDGKEMTNLELFELSQISFAEIKWSKEYDGLITVIDFFDNFYTLKVDFNSIEKFTLDLSESTLFKYKNYDENDFVTIKSIVQRPEIEHSRPQTIAAHHEDEEWTKEQLEEIEQFKKFVRMKNSGK